MSGEQQETKYNPLYRTAIYPEAASIFSFRPKPLSEVKDDCLVILDTNALLVPYTTGKESLEEIGKIYRQLVEQKRLVVPGQVAREFAEHRVTKIKELYQQIARKKASIGLGRYPLLDGVSEYKKALELENKLNESIPAYNKAIDKILDVIGDWYWNDPVSKLYSELFSEVVVIDLILDEAAVKERLDRDNKYKMPPGYKDGCKPDDGIGDLLIWLTILEMARKYKKSAVFISLDRKPDWWSKSEGRHLYPRYELIEEYRRNSEGESFHSVTFSSFLSLYGATDSVVEEVRKEEDLSRTGISIGFGLSKQRIRRRYAFFEWLKKEYDPLQIDSTKGRFDYVITTDRGARIGVITKLVISPEHAHKESDEFAATLPIIQTEEERVDGFLLALIAFDEDAARAVESRLLKFGRFVAGVRYVVGYKAEKGEFVATLDLRY